MQYRALGGAGMQASVVGFGAWAIGGWMWGGTEVADAIRAIHAALDNGINLLDTAPIYGQGVSEEIVGRAIGERRDEVLLATKCGMVWHLEKGVHLFNTDDAHPREDGQTKVYKYLGPESVRYEVEQSLARLKTDRIDLYQTHWQDKTTPIEETMAELLKLKDEGKIRAIGVSNATPRQMDRYRKAGPIASDQERYSMLDREHEKDCLPYCEKHGLAFLAYSPLAQGLLTGKIRSDRKFAPGDQRRKKPRFSLENRLRVGAMLEQFRPIAERHGATLAQLAIAWTVRQPGCTHALVGARSPEQAQENAKAGDIELDEQELLAIQRAIDEHVRREEL